MLSITEPIGIELEVKKSKFISHLVPYNQFPQWQKKLKEEHPKARHIVYAYRFINEFDQIVENQSDDGEPKGSSGPPSLSALRGKELVNTAVLTVRYFGGIKLGVGGLVRAYGKSVNDVIIEAEKRHALGPYKKLNPYTIEISLRNLARLEHFLKNMHSEHLNYTRDFTGNSCTLTITAPEEEITEIKIFIQDL